MFVGVRMVGAHCWCSYCANSGGGLREGGSSGDMECSGGGSFGEGEQASSSSGRDAKHCWTTAARRGRDSEDAELLKAAGETGLDGSR